MPKLDQTHTNANNVDIAIIGGGIAGLWLLNKLCNEGYNAVLFEQDALGSQQTVASQGMIHGGIKYTLGGALSGASEAIADMPKHWQRCLAGQGDVDLQAAHILSDHFYMFSSSGAGSKMTAFLASKAMRGRVDKVKNKDLPSLFQHPDFSGSVYRLVDMVLDVPSVIKALADNYSDRIWKIDWSKTQLIRNADGIVSLQLDNGEQLTAQRFVFTAGLGNEALLQQLQIATPKMQCRPLQQVMVKHHYPHPFYGHCLGMDKTPRLTISSHPCKDGSQAWYLGGSLAENGVGKAPDVLIAEAKQEIAELLPWIDLGDAKWATLNVDRAEPKQNNLARPDKAFASSTDHCDNVIVAWPTKLSLAPNLATEVIALLQTQNISASDTSPPSLPLARPGIAENPWDTDFE